jgi:hypothetical protein
MDGAARATGRGSLSLMDRAEHFRRIMAEIIASCPASRPDHC